MAEDHTVVKSLTRQERFDFRLSRRLPKLSGRANRVVYRLTRGRVGGAKRGIPIGLLTVKGRRSGKSRTVPLMFRDDGDRFLVVSSNGGFDSPPAWYLNLSAAPIAEFQTRNGVHRVVARDLTESEHDAIWGSLATYNPLWAAFQSCTQRTTTIVALESIDESGAPGHRMQR